jgi:hypothetical protein
MSAAQVDVTPLGWDRVIVTKDGEVLRDYIVDPLGRVVMDNMSARNAVEQLVKSWTDNDPAAVPLSSPTI